MPNRGCVFLLDVQMGQEGLGGTERKEGLVLVIDSGQMGGDGGTGGQGEPGNHLIYTQSITVPERVA